MRVHQAWLLLFCVGAPSMAAAQFQADSSLGSDALWEPLFPWVGPRGVDDFPSDATVTKVVALGERIVVYGDFHGMDDVSADGFAVLENGTWRAMSDGPPPSPPEVLRVHDGELLAGGRLSSQDSPPDWNDLLYRWTGTGWESFGPDLSGGSPRVVSMAEFSGRLVVAIRAERSFVLLRDGGSWIDITGRDSTEYWYDGPLCEFRGALYMASSRVTSRFAPPAPGAFSDGMDARGGTSPPYRAGGS